MYHLSNALFNFSWYNYVIFGQPSEQPRHLSSPVQAAMFFFIEILGATSKMYHSEANHLFFQCWKLSFAVSTRKRKLVLIVCLHCNGESELFSHVTGRIKLLYWLGHRGSNTLCHHYSDQKEVLAQNFILWRRHFFPFMRNNFLLYCLFFFTTVLAVKE